jgi:hypothetical protein
MGEGEELPATHTEIVPTPLDVESVALSLWPLGDIQIVTNQEEENGVE